MGRWNDEETPDYNEDDALWIEQSNARVRAHSGYFQTTGEETVKDAPALRALIEKAQEELARLVELEKIAARPAEPFADVAVTIVVLFRFQYDGRGKVYTFAAVRTDRKWYMTGSGTPSVSSWHGMLEWFEARGKLIGPIQLAERWEDVPS